MDQPNQSSVLGADLVIDNVGESELRQFAKWAKFLSIIGFIFTGLIILVGLFFSTFMAKVGSFSGVSPSMPGMMGSIMAVFYIVFALIYFFPVLYLFQASNKLKGALDARNQEELNMGFTKMKACFRYLGILTIIVLGLYALIFVFALIGLSAMR